MNNQPYQSLMMLAIHINKKIINLISDNKIHGYDYSIIEGQKFQYNDVNGFNKFKTVTRDTKKVDWFEVMSFDNSIENSYEYNRALKNLSIFFGKDPEKLKNRLNDFVKKVIKRILSKIEIHEDFKLDTKFDGEIVIGIINSFLKELNGNTTKFQLEIELTGIILRTNKIKIDDNTILRRPTVKDLNKQFIKHSPYKSATTNPSAILVITFPHRENELIEPETIIDYLIAFFKLFNVGNVQSLYYKIKTDATKDMFHLGMFNDFDYTSIDQLRELSSQKRYAITTFLVTPLKNFIKKMDENGLKVFDNKKYLHINIAYNHYNKALSNKKEKNVMVETEDELYFFESMIAEVIMGLEALFLGKSERSELPYRVSMRIAKLFDSIIFNEPKFVRNYLKDSYDPENVFKRVKDGYSIRNKLAHGDRPSNNKIKDLNKKYGNIGKLLFYLLDYLRISIIIMHFYNKEELLKSIDNAMIKNEKNLNESLPEVKNLLLLLNNDLSTEMMLSWKKSKNL